MVSGVDKLRASMLTLLVISRGAVAIASRPRDGFVLAR